MSRALETFYVAWIIGLIVCWWTGTYDIPHRLAWPLSAIMDVTSPPKPPVKEGSP